MQPADIAHLLRLLQGLVKTGSTVIVVEHNPDAIKRADWILVPGPEVIAASPGSITGQMPASR